MGVLLSWVVALAIACRFKKRLGEVATIGILVITIIITLVSKFSNYDMGCYCAFIFCALCFFYVIYKLIVNRNALKETILSPDSIALLFFIIFFAVNSMGRGITGRDESTYWGWALKGFYYYNYSMVLDIHPKMAIMWALFAEKSWITFSDSMALWAFDVLTVSLFLPFFGYIKKDKIWNSIALVAVTLLLPLSFHSVAYMAILADAIFSVAVGFTAVACYRYFTIRQKFNWIQILFGLYLISGTKRIGMLWCGLLCFMLAYMLCKYEGFNRSTFFKFIEIVAIPDLTYMIWLGKSYYQLIPILLLLCGILVFYFISLPRMKRSILICVISLVCIIVGGYIVRNVLMQDDLRRKYTIDYINAIFSNADISWGNIVGVSIFSFLLMFSTLLLYINNKEVNIWKLDNGVFLTQGVLILISCVVFLASVSIVFANATGLEIAARSNGGSIVPTFRRYSIGIYLIILFLCMCYYLDNCDYFYKLTGKVFYKYPFAVLLLITIFMTDESTLSKYILEKQEHVDFYGFEKAGITLTPMDSIFYIQEVKMDVDEQYRVGPAFQYDMFPAWSVVENDFWYKTLEENGHKYLSKEAFSKVLTDGKYSYVYIQNVDDEFSKLYGEMFENVDSFISGSVFRVETDESNLVKLKTLYNGN